VIKPERIGNRDMYHTREKGEMRGEFSVENLKKKERKKRHLEDLNIDGKMIL
jgi:hypothetical protein